MEAPVEELPQEAVKTPPSSVVESSGVSVRRRRAPSSADAVSLHLFPLFSQS